VGEEDFGCDVVHWGNVPLMKAEQTLPEVRVPRMLPCVGAQLEVGQQEPHVSGSSVITTHGLVAASLVSLE
jgi:hypothetical protein